MEAEASQGGTIEPPCFEKATSIQLDLGFLGISMPPAGVFARLTELHLESVWIYGPGALGDVVSSPRCPCLQKLCIVSVKGLDCITINSKSLQLLTLQSVYDVHQITVVAPALRDLILLKWFILEEYQHVVSISAPQLKSLMWDDAYNQSSVDLGSMEHLETLNTHFCVYGIDGFADNSACLMLLPRFEAIKNLVLRLFYPPDINHLHYMMEGLISLPDVTSLSLIVQTRGHFFGASTFHVLKLCSSIKRLILFLSQVSEEPSACSSSGCICDQPTNWKTEEISLNHLQELELKCFGASEHEVAFVERLFNWVPVLKTMTVTFHPSITENKAKELIQMFRGFSRPGLCMKFYRASLGLASA